MPVHRHRRQGVPHIVVPEIARLLNKDRPRRDPQPELFDLVGEERQLVCFRRVSLEPPGLGFAHVHDAEECRIREQFDIFVRIRHGRRHEAVRRRSFKQAHELAKRLRPAEPAEDGRLVEPDDGEPLRIKFAVADALVVRQVEPVHVHFVVAANELDGHAELGGVANEFLPHAERADDQPAPVLAFQDQANRLDRLHCLAEPEGREDRPLPAAARPTNTIPLVRFEHGIDFGISHLDAGFLRDRHLGPEKLRICVERHRRAPRVLIDSRYRMRCVCGRQEPLLSSCCHSAYVNHSRDWLSSPRNSRVTLPTPG